MEALTKALLQIPELAELLRRVEDGRCPAALSGAAPVHRAQIAAALAAGLDRPLVMVCGDDKEAGRLRLDLQTLMGEEPLVLPARDFQLTAASFSHAWEHRRVAALHVHQLFHVDLLARHGFNLFFQLSERPQPDPPARCRPP